MDMIEIIIFAMIAAFVALRLFSVLGSRPDEDAPQRPVPVDARGNGPVALDEDAVAERADPFEGVKRGAVRDGLEKIARADRSFAYPSFKEGATAAYEMILEGFWKGERATYEPYVAQDIAEDFNAALQQRIDDGLTVENRLIDIDNIEAVEAALDGKTAEITMAFTANIVAVTRDAQGDVVDGSLSDTYQTRDLWTFSRKVGSRDPNWLVVATESEGVEDAD